jgi:hypothetical protein
MGAVLPGTAIETPTVVLPRHIEGSFSGGSQGTTILPCGIGYIDPDQDGYHYPLRLDQLDHDLVNQMAAPVREAVGAEAVTEAAYEALRAIAQAQMDGTAAMKESMDYTPTENDQPAPQIQKTTTGAWRTRSAAQRIEQLQRQPTVPEGPPPPRIPVTFDLDKFGELTFFYHEVVVGEGCITLAYDRRHQGNRYFPPLVPCDQEATADDRVYFTFNSYVFSAVPRFAFIVRDLECCVLQVIFTGLDERGRPAA